MATPGPKPTSRTLSVGWMSSRPMTQAAHASFERAMMWPPSLPRAPRGRPNIRIKTLRTMFISRGYLP
jgi:hypothetical protein